MSSSRDPEDRDRSDPALVAAMERRDADALASLYDRHAARLLGLAYRILGETGEAEEVVQEVFLYAWRSAGSFDSTRGSVLAWLLIATRSRAIDRIRARRPVAAVESSGRDPLDELPAREDVEGTSASREWEEACRRAIRGLPPEQRRVLELAYFGGLTHPEISERTATPLGTVKTRIRLGLMKLRESMGPYWTRGRNA
ncbi:MAG TPA: sigma-70 family RNA polymerase sigma factor [Thermoanaerobaculia bacterium]|nr:sigma-70 family RNA polymerase sigma factor [Thermoanaerobaculia bacterium]